MLKAFLAGLRSRDQNIEVVKSLNSAGTDGGRGVYTLSGGGFARGGRELIAAYNANPNLRKVVGIIANALTATPFYLVKKSDKRKKSKAWPLHVRALGRQDLRQKAAQSEAEKVWDHEFLEFLYRGSPLMPGPQALKASYAYKEIKGEFFWQLFAGERTAPASWIVVPPQCVDQIPSHDKQAYVLRSGGRVYSVPAEDMFWVKDLNLSDVWGRGAGIGDALSDEIDSDEYAASLLRITLANKGFKDTLISIRSDVGANDTLAEELETKYNQRSRGFYNSGRAMVVDGAQVEVKQLTYDLKELRLLELREFERDIIYQTFGVPPEMFGLVENSNRATIETAEAIFAKQVLVPRLEQMRLEMQLRLLPLFDPKGQYVLEYVSPVPADRKHRLEVMESFPSAYTINEWRAESHHEPVDWGEERVGAVQEIPQDVSTKGKKRLPSVYKATAVEISEQEIQRLTEKIDSKELVQKLGPDWRGAMLKEAEKAYAAFPGATGEFALVNPLIADHLEEFGARWVRDIDATTQSLVGKTLAQGVDAGEGISELSKRIRETMGDIADGYRSELIARTESGRSANAARQMGWQATELDLTKRWISALVSTTRDSHAALHNEERDVKGTWTFDGALEPNVVETVAMPVNASDPAHSCNCVIPGQLVEGKIEAGIRSEYHGRVVTINTLKGHKVTLTPNHPVLTSRGWIAAGDVRKGDDLISHSHEIGSGIAANSVYQAPTAIEKVFGALTQTGKSLRRGLRPNDLHGDAVNVIGDVDIVGINRELMLPIDRRIGTLQASQEFGFEASYLSSAAISPSHASSNIIGLSSSLPSFGKVLFNGRSVPASSVIPRRSLSFGAGSQWHAGLSKPTGENGSANSRFFAELQDRGTGFVSLDQVVEVGDSEFNGHVYDLQSDVGWIVANGIVISNCLCTAVAFDPEHKSVDTPYGSDVHQQLCKSFENTVDTWAAATKRQMKPFYDAMADDLVFELKKMSV